MVNFRRFKMLFWKYLNFRKYYWIATIFEVILPIILMYGVIGFSHKLIPKELYRKRTNVEIETNITDSFLFKYNAYEKIYYCPAFSNDSFIEDDIMQRVREVYLNVAQNGDVVIQRLKNEETLVRHIIREKINVKVAGIVFIERPRFVLHYKIRDANEWNTSDLYAPRETEISGPYAPDPYYTTGFAGLQSAVNRAFYDRYAAHESSGTQYQQIYFDNQEFQSRYKAFPYPKYLQSRPERRFFPIIIGFVILLTSLILTGPLTIGIITERESGVKEWMKIAGLPEKLLWFSWFLNSLIMSLFVYSIITFLLIYGLYAQGPVIQFVSPLLLFFIIMLFFMTQLAFCFMFCAIFHTPGNAMASFAMSTLVLGFIALKLHEFGNRFLVYCTCIFPPSALIQIFIRIGYYELLGQTLEANSLFLNETNGADATVGYVLMYLIFDLILYFFLTYYISAINPGKFGFKKPWYFMFQKLMKKPIARPSNTSEEMIKNMELAQKYTEGPINSAQGSLVLKDLQKQFGYTEAVRKVNLTAYKSEIMVLLGHDGAGKTTTLSMITGLVKPTFGSIHYKKILNIITRLTEFRQVLGYCPEEDRLIPYMTAMDILVFFGKLKDKTDEDVHIEAMAYLKLMDMSTKAGDLTSSLNSDLKRKLCLCIALMGKSEVIVLDEPTIGVDNQSKEKIWNLLKELKHERTIIVTTDNMNEAVKIGDRIAIINHGMIVCNGSANFLKRNLGGGYEVTVYRRREMDNFAQTLKDPSVMVIDAVLKGIRGSRLESRTPTKLVFFIPEASAPRFPALFKTLETRKDQLRVDNINVSYTSLDNVFQKVGGNSIYDEQGKLVKSLSEFEERRYIRKKQEKVKGPKLIVQQHMALIWKKNLFTLRNVTTFFLHVIVPTIIMIILIRSTINDNTVEAALTLNLNLYPSSKVIITKEVPNVNFRNSRFTTLMKNYYYTYNILFATVANQSIDSALLQYAEKNIASYRRELIYGHNFNFEEENTPNTGKYRFFITEYNKFFRHSLPVAVNTIDNNILQFFFNNPKVQITTINHPVRSVTDNKSPVAIINEIYHRESRVFTVWFLMVAFFTIDLLDYFIILIKVERIDGFKQLQYLSRLSPLTYWINTFIYDFIVFFIIVLIRMCLIKPFDSYGFFTLQHHALVVLLLVILFMISGLFFIYAVSFFQTSKYGSYIFFLIFNFTCTFVTSTYLNFEMYLLMGKDVPSSERIILMPTRYIILLVPPLNFSLAFQKLVLCWRNNILAESKTNPEVLDKAPRYINLSSFEHQNYLEVPSAKNPNGILIELIFLVVCIFLYAWLLVLMEKNTLQMIDVSLFTTKQSESSESEELNENENQNAIGSQSVPPNVVMEKAKVKSLIKGDDEQEFIENEEEKHIAEWDGRHTVVVHNLSKLRKRSLRTTTTVVEDINFAVESGQCFGLLGRDAGNSEILQMVSGSVRPTSGDSYIQNVNLREKRNKYLSNIGYCSVQNAFLDDLTGREHLELVAMLKGVEMKHLDQTVEYWTNALDLESVQNKTCGTYSGGSRRKLSSAIALLGDPKVIILDRPTAGVDATSRRKLYTVLERLKVTGETILLASDSMGECEALCERVTVLVDGRMRFIGTIGELKSQYASGFSAIIIMRPMKPGEKPAARQAIIDSLKKNFLIKFPNAVLEEETEESHHYVIQETLQWGEGFQKMEELKKSQKVILQYQLSEISLQEAYDSFYK